MIFHNSGWFGKEVASMYTVVLGIPVIVTAKRNKISVSVIQIGDTMPAVGVVRAKEARVVGSAVIGMVAADIAAMSLIDGTPLVMNMAVSMSRKFKIGISHAYAECVLRLLGVTGGSSHGSYEIIKEYSDSLMSEDL